MIDKLEPRQIQDFIKIKQQKSFLLSSFLLSSLFLCILAHPWGSEEGKQSTHFQRAFESLQGNFLAVIVELKRLASSEV